MDLDATQLIPLSDYDDETDEEVCGSQKEPVANLAVGCQKGFPGKTFPIYEGDNIIGRQERCNVHIPIKALSKEHACIEVHGENFLIYDKGSRNKSRRGKLVLTPDVRYELRDDDKLTFADVHCTFTIVKSQQEVIADSGSETESESMLPDTQPVNNTKPSAAQLVNETLLYKEELESDDNNSCSSDLLQPTQAYAEDGSGPLLQKPQLASTLMYAEDSEDETDGPKDIPFSPVMDVVAETPFTRKSEVLPESDVEESSPIIKTDVQQTLVFNDEDDVLNGEEKSTTLDEPTQVYDMDERTDEDNNMNDEEKYRLLEEPTQAYDMDEGTEDEDTDLNEEEKRRLLEEPTQAYDMDDRTKDENKDLNEEEKRRLLKEPTQAYDMDDRTDDETDGDLDMATQAYPEARIDDNVDPVIFEEPTQAYDQESDSDSKSETMLPATVPYTLEPDEKKDVNMDIPTQAYTMDVEVKPEKSPRKATDNATLEYDMDVEDSNKNGNGEDESTQKFDLENLGNSENVMNENPNERQTLGGNTEEDFNESTLSEPSTSHLQKSEQITNENSTNDSSTPEATQILKNSTVDEKVCDAKKEMLNKSHEQTVVKDSQDINLVMDVSTCSEISFPKHDCPNQRNKKNVSGIGEAEADEDMLPTQVYAEDAESLETDENVKPSCTTNIVKRRPTFEDDIPTQNYPDPQHDESSEDTVNNNVKSEDHPNSSANNDGSNEATQVYLEADECETQHKGHKNSDDATPIVEETCAPTQAFNDDASEIAAHKSSSAVKNQPVESSTSDEDNDATQAFAETDAPDIPQESDSVNNDAGNDDATLELQETCAPTLAFDNETETTARLLPDNPDIDSNDATLELPATCTATQAFNDNDDGVQLGDTEAPTLMVDNELSPSSASNTSKAYTNTDKCEESEMLTSPIFGKVSRWKKVVETEIDDFDTPTQAFPDACIDTEMDSVKETHSKSPCTFPSPVKSSLRSTHRRSPSPKKVTFIKQILVGDVFAVGL